MGVYVIGNPDRGPVKIGYSNSEASLGGRLIAHQCGHPYDLAVLRWWPDLTFQDEQALHRRLEHDRLRGEWFEPTLAVCTVLDLPAREVTDMTVISKLKKMLEEELETTTALRQILCDLVGDDWLMRHALQGLELDGRTPDPARAAQRIYPGNVGRPQFSDATKRSTDAIGAAGRGI